MMLVRSPEPERLAAALPAAAAQLDVPVFGPDATPGGWLLMVDFGDGTPAARHDALVGFAAQLKVDGEILPAPEIGDRYLTLDGFPVMARAMLRSPGQTVGMPPTAEVVSAALDWLQSCRRPGDELLGLIVSMESPLSWPRVRPMLDMVLQGEAGASVLTTDFATAAAAVSFPSSHLSGPTLTAAGAGWGPAEVADRMRAQRDHIRRHAGVLGWAGVTAQGTRTGSVWLSDNGRYEAAQPRPLWYQMLTAEQVRHLGDPPKGATPLPGGRAEVTIGEPEQWVPGHRDNRTVERLARRILKT
ncbi:hypothetical protein [Catenuloplanes nepalensis]|uniref:hypothetical protein n=1 Tax=Catenuloplanes nepalensis TaxID=587533 RepID=UPI0027D8AE88|nr:hypothetical protein [Catenuloplanes nepalensis]